MSTASLERSIEQAIAAAIDGLSTGFTTLGFFTPSAAGVEKTQPSSVIGIRVPPRDSEGFESDLVTLNVTVTVTSSGADDLTGSVFVGAFEAVMGLFETWDTDDDAAAAALDLSGVFRCDAVKLSGGDCGYEESKGVWFATVQLDVKGCITRN